jgi:hypothetical protein
MVCLTENRPVVWKVFNHRSVRSEWFGAMPHFLFSTRDVSPIIIILIWCYTRIQNILTAWCLWEATTVTQQFVTSASWELLRVFVLMVSIFWCAAFSVWVTSWINRHRLMHLKTILSYYQTYQYIMYSNVQFVRFFIRVFCVLAVVDWYQWKEGLWVLNFEDSRCHDVGRYETLPLVMLTVHLPGMWHNVIWQVPW